MASVHLKCLNCQREWQQESQTEMWQRVAVCESCQGILVEKLKTNEPRKRHRIDQANIS